MKYVEQEIKNGGTLIVQQKNCGRDYVSAHILRKDATDICGMGLTVADAIGCLDADLQVEEFEKNEKAAAK